MIGSDVQRNLLFVNQLLVQAAGFSASQDGCCEIRLGVTRLENGRGKPRLVHARQLHIVLNHYATLGGDWRGFGGNPRHFRPALERAKILFDERLGLLRLEVADDGEAGVVRSVVQLEEIPDVFQFCGLNVFMRADDVGVIRMAFRIKQMHHAFFDDSVRRVFHALTPLVAHDVLLIRKTGLIELVGQIAHAVGLQPKRQLELIRGERLEIVGAIEVRGSVDVARARRFQQMKMRAPWNVTRAFKHHVLEKMRETRAAGELVGRTYVVPQIHGHHRQAMIFGEDDVEAVL